MLFGIIPSLLGALTYILTIYYALLWFIPYLFDKLVGARIHGFASTLVFPSTVVSLEYLNNVFFGSWASTAYTQFDHLALIQVSSLVGIWGISFIVCWFASVVNWVIDHHFEWSAIKRGLTFYAAILSLTLLYGGIRLEVFPPQSDTITISSFTPTTVTQEYNQELQNKGFSSSIQMAKENRKMHSTLLRSVHEKVFEQNKQIVDPNVKLTFWPEGLIKVLEEQEAAFIEQGKIWAMEQNVYLVMAYFVIPIQNPERMGENKAVLINPKGELEWEYLKTYPVPGSPNKPGGGVLPVSDTPFGRISTVICYDMDFTGLLHQAGRLGIDILVVPAWDWKAIDPLHARMAVFRAIENGFSMVRQTGEGLSIAVDYQGRTLAAMDHFTSDDLTMRAQVPKHGVSTVYAVIGDLFAWLCLVCLFSAIGWSILKRKKSVL
jgi:apolipoprotein N-acyltransferase